MRIFTTLHKHVDILCFVQVTPDVQTALAQRNLLTDLDATVAYWIDACYDEQEGWIWGNGKFEIYTKPEM